LDKNHDSVKSVRLIVYHKQSKLKGIRLDEAVEEALCFGWIDGRANKRDADSFFVLFTKRSPRSSWSKSNRQRVERLLQQGRLTQAGLEAIERAKRDGTWTALDGIQAHVIPDDLQKAFDQQPSAAKSWQEMAPSSREMYLAWIANAKRPETRQRRIEETVKRAGRAVNSKQ
jgi:uncharacterized protein YdeI (YjbR/CyaY-like superfamily)